jgi:hypothetical protein
MSILRIYVLAIPVFALFFLGVIGGAAALERRSDLCPKAYSECRNNCKEKPTTAAQNACKKHCAKKYCPQDIPSDGQTY